MTRLRLGIVGAGHLGFIHARLANKLDLYELIGVADSSKHARERAGRELKVSTFSDYRDLASQIDAAVVATPTVSHHPITAYLLENGVHSLVEKPLATTATDSESLVHIAQSHDRVLQVGHIERFNPVWESVPFDVGCPKYIEATRTSGYTFRSTDIGVVLDVMIHDIDIVLTLVKSRLKRVDALGISLMGQHEDMAQARLVFENGCVVNLSASRVSYASQRIMQIYGERGFAEIDFAGPRVKFVQPASRILERKVDVDSLSNDEKQFFQAHFDELLPVKEIEPAPRNAIVEELLDFGRSINRGTVPRVSGQHGVQAVAVAERILDALERHQWNGEESGPVGPFAEPALSVWRSPRSWNDWRNSSKSDRSDRRRAG